MFNKTDFIGIAGFIITVIGFFLTPLFIGIPIMLVGWLILIYSVLKRLVDTFVPKDVQDKVVQETIKGYSPYKPAMKSLRGLIWEMIKIAALVAGAVILTIVVFARLT